MTTAASVLANMTAATMTTEATDYVTYMVQNVTNIVQNVTESGLDAGGDAAREVWQVRMREVGRRTPTCLDKISVVFLKLCLE